MLFKARMGFNSLCGGSVDVFWNDNVHMQPQKPSLYKVSLDELLQKQEQFAYLNNITICYLYTMLCICTHWIACLT
jgi:hypothetical protein